MREMLAHHDAGVTADLGAAGRLHALCPQFTVVDLCRAAVQVGPVRNAVLHFHHCVACSPAELCSDAVALVAKMVTVMPTIGQGRREA